MQGKGPRRGFQKRLGRRLETVAKAAGGRLLSVTNGVGAGGCGQGESGWAIGQGPGGGGGGYLAPFQRIPARALRCSGGPQVAFCALHLWHGTRHPEYHRHPEHSLWRCVGRLGPEVYCVGLLWPIVICVVDELVKSHRRREFQNVQKRLKLEFETRLGAYSPK